MCLMLGGGTRPWLDPREEQDRNRVAVWVGEGSTTVVSGSVRPHRRQLTRLPRPWDSPGIRGAHLGTLQGALGVRAIGRGHRVGLQAC